MSDKNIQFLLLIEALKNTNRNDSKTTDELANDIELAWKKIFPDKPQTTISTSTIGRHIKDMNATGLYNIITAPNTQDGYYNDKFLLEPAEFAIIVQSIFRSSTLPITATRRLLDKLLSQTGAIGKAYYKTVYNQISAPSRAPKRKTSRKTLDIIKIIVKAIAEEKQISFTCYNQDDRDNQRVELVRNKDGDKVKRFIVSPYYIVWESDECYLIGHLENEDDKEMKLSHFKIYLIDPERIFIMDRTGTSIAKMKEYDRYVMGSTVPARKVVKDNINRTYGEALQSFFLDRYMRENLYMVHDEKNVVDVHLVFKESFEEEILSRFNRHSKRIKAYPNGQATSGGEQLCSAYITVQPNEGFYTWLMGHVNQVLIAEPAEIRQEVKRRLQVALDTINAYN